jgi:hypothetical protein
MSAREKALVPAFMAIVASLLVATAGISLYTKDNADRCGGGLGRIGPALGFYLTLAVALLVTLVALGFALVLALRSHRWAWVVGLVVVTAASVLITINSSSVVFHALVGSVLGFGCSWYQPEVVQSLAPLLVAAPTLACLITGLQHKR